VRKNKYVLSILLFLILFFGTYYFVLKDYSLQMFFDSLQGCDVKFIIYAILLMCGYVFFASYYLKRMLYHFGKKINWYQGVGYLATEIYFSAITPSSIGGQPIQMVEMNKDKIPYRMNSIVILLNTVIYKIALIFLAILSFLFYGNLLFSQSKIFVWLVLLGFITTIFVILLFLALIYSKELILRISHFILNLLEKIHLLKKKREWEEKLMAAVKEYQSCATFTKEHPRVLIESFIILLLQRICILSVSYMIYLAFGKNEINIFEMIAFQTCITLASDFIPSPGGVGVSEGLLLQINGLIYGAMVAPAAMMLLRGVSFYIIVILSGIFYLFFHFKKRKGASAI